jgi:hypothetical protein
MSAQTRAKTATKNALKAEQNTTKECARLQAIVELAIKSGLDRNTNALATIADLREKVYANFATILSTNYEINGLTQHSDSKKIMGLARMVQDAATRIEKLTAKITQIANDYIYAIPTEDVLAYANAVEAYYITNEERLAQKTQKIQAALLASNRLRERFLSWRERHNNHTQTPAN